MKDARYIGEVVPTEIGDSPLGLHPLSKNCTVEGCGKHLMRLLSVHSSSIGRNEDRWFYLDRCLNCNFFGDVISHQYDSEGAIIWSNSVKPSDVECLNLIQDQCRPGSVAAIRWRELRPEEQFDCAPPLAGSNPYWETDTEEFCCPKCGGIMEYILQLSSSGMDPRRDALGYHRGGTQRRWQGTSIDGFEISIEHYSTLYLFFCFNCNVATNFTQS